MRKPNQIIQCGDLYAICRLHEKSCDAVILMEGTRVKWYNPSAEMLFGPVKLQTADCIGLLDLQKKIIESDKFKEDGYHRCESVLENKADNSFNAELSFIRLHENEGGDCFIIIRDIENQVRTRQNFERSYMELKRLRKEVHMQQEEIESHRDIIETQRDVAVRQRDEISLHQKEIKSSIQYARRIQSALLPSRNAFKMYFPDFFILYKPKDIVSGDFYWISADQERIVIAAGDCTGHGVPGALMSMLGITFLNEIDNISGIVRTDQILNNLRERIIQSLHQKGAAGEAQDGMDMAIISVKHNKGSLEFSGASNPMFLFRDSALHEFRGDRMPLGYDETSKSPFTANEVKLLPGDAIYLFSDGFSDQFGWRENRKLKPKNFKNLLLEIQNIPMKAQEKVLDSHLEIWKGDLEQLDDILVLGLKI